MLTNKKSNFQLLELFSYLRKLLFEYLETATRPSASTSCSSKLFFLLTTPEGSHL